MSKFSGRVAAVAIGALIIGGTATTGAVAAGKINSFGILNDSVRSVDLQDGAAVRWADLTPALANSVKSSDASLREQIDALEDRVAALEAQDASGVNTNWTANPGSSVTDSNTVELTKATSGAADGTSVEILNLDLPVQAGDVVSFSYALSDGAACTSGAPRVYVEMDGTYLNSWDENIGAGTQCGTEGVVTFSLPSNGRVGAAGVVFDDGPAGTITVSDLTIGGTPIRFQ